LISAAMSSITGNASTSPRAATTILKSGGLSARDLVLGAVQVCTRKESFGRADRAVESL